MNRGTTFVPKTAVFGTQSL